MRRWIVPILLLETLGTGAAVAGEYGHQMAVVDGYLLVSAFINGHGPFRMMIDTGASTCSLTPKAAAAAGLVPNHRVTLETLAGVTTVPADTNATLRVGELESAAVETLILPIPGARQVDRGVEGVLGQTFLSRYPYLIDYRARRLWFGDEAIRRASALPAVYAASRSHGRLALTVSVQPGRDPLRLILDSGASNLVLNCASARCPNVNATSGGLAMTNGGTLAVTVGALPRLRIGEICLKGVQAVLLHSPRTEDTEDGVIPTRLFSAVYIDDASGIVRLAR